MQPLLRTFLVVTLTLLAGGCGSSKGRVTGTISYKNDPVTMGTITFFVEGAPPVSASIANGQYEALDVPPGEAVIVVSGPPPDTGPGVKPKKQTRGETGQPPPPTPTGPVLPGRYGKAETSNLKFLVEKGSNTYNIALTD
jgi:hypothetical protein